MTDGNPNGLSHLHKYAASPPPSLRYLQNADESSLRSIDRGVLFLMAFWSGTSIQSYRRLTETIAAENAEDVELVVVDVDGSPGLYDLPDFRGTFGGNGETAWIRRGRVIAATFGGDGYRSYADHFAKLRAAD